MLEFHDLLDCNHIVHIGVQDSKQEVDETTLHEAEEEFYEEPRIVCQEFKALAEAILIAATI